MADSAMTRLMLRVERIPICGCWIFAFADDGRGYGRIWIHGCVMRAHRASWLLHRGAIPQGADVLHHCDVPACVNPDHLFLGDKTANMRDMARKHRQVFQAHPEKIKRGEACFHAKLSENAVREIIVRTRYGHTGADLARDFGVSQSTISAILHGRIWRHISRTFLPAANDDAAIVAAGGQS